MAYDDVRAEINVNEVALMVLLHGKSAVMVVVCC